MNPKNTQFTRRQHWVPQFYLRYFASKADQNKLYVTDTKQFYRTNEGNEYALGAYDTKRLPTTAIACHDYLYSDLIDQTWSNKLEDEFFQPIERKAAIALSKCISGRADIAGESEDKAVISMFLASLHLRHPRMVSISLGQSSADELFDDSPKSVVLREEFRSIQELALDIAPYIRERQWEILTFKDPVLVTSDTPFFVVEGVDFKASSLDCESSSAFFPLSPQHLLMMFGAKVPRQDVKLPTFATAAQGENINRFIINFSDKYVYSSKKLSSEWARDIMRTKCES